MSEIRPARPTLALIVAIWLLVAFVFDAFGLVSATLLAAAHASVNTMSPLQLGLAALSALLALGGGILLLQMKSSAWPILITRFAVELGIAILVFQALKHPIALPASAASNPNAATMVTAVKATSMAVTVLMLLVNLGIALYARMVTACKTPAVEPLPPAIA